MNPTIKSLIAFHRYLETTCELDPCVGYMHTLRAVIANLPDDFSTPRFGHNSLEPLIEDLNARIPQPQLYR